MYGRSIAAFALVAPLAAHAADTKPPFTQDHARKIIGDLQKVVSPNGIDQ